MFHSAIILWYRNLSSCGFNNSSTAIIAIFLLKSFYLNNKENSEKRKKHAITRWMFTRKVNVRIATVCATYLFLQLFPLICLYGNPLLHAAYWYKGKGRDRLERRGREE